MKKLNDKKQVAAQISAAARLYKKNLVGKHFLYVFDGRAEPSRWPIRQRDSVT